MMKPETYSAIEMLLAADTSVDETRRKDVLAVCRRRQKRHRKLITVRRAAELLDCHPRTVERYAAKGLLTQVRFSPRKIRYDLDEVEAFARNGMEGARNGEDGE